MKSNAPGAFLGFGIQIPRALVHLLKAGPGDSVCVEVLGDVATEKATGDKIAEEDKATTTDRNPLADRSTDLWKTFSNWITAARDGEITVQKTRFILYCNKAGAPGIVNEFDAALTEDEAGRAISAARTKLSTMDKSHGAWNHYDFVVNQHENLFVQLVQRFELQIGKGAGYREVQDELRRKILPTAQIPFLQDRLVGWLHKTLSESIAARKPARIRWEEFDKQFKVAFDRSRCMELIDFTLHDPIEQGQVDYQLRVLPCYLKQLCAIGCDESELIDAVNDYLRAQVNRDKWIEIEMIDEDAAEDFEQRLIRFWRNQRKRLALTSDTSDEKLLGQLLLADCCSRQEPIRSMPPPSPTIAGTYHALADEPVLGWHPTWEALFKNA